MPKGDRPPEPLAPEEVKALLVACGGGSLSAQRDHALYVVLWRAGLRIGEALRLRSSDINFADGTARVLHTKTRAARTVGLDDQTLAAVSVWIEARRGAGITDGPLFCRLKGKPGAPLSSRYVGQQLARLAVAVGLKHRVHPHSFRHSMACDSAREGIPVPLISRQLGHSSIATTTTYLQGLYPSEVVDAYRARSWVS
jgi:integrase